MFTATAAHACDYNHKTKEYTLHTNRPIMFRAYANNVTAEDMAVFPRYVNVRFNASRGTARFEVLFSEDGVNKGKNEAGIKRLKKFLELATVEFNYGGAVNSYRTIDQLVANI